MCIYIQSINRAFLTRCRRLKELISIISKYIHNLFLYNNYSSEDLHKKINSLHCAVCAGGSDAYIHIYTYIYIYIYINIYIYVYIKIYIYTFA